MAGGWDRGCATITQPQNLETHGVFTPPPPPPAGTPLLEKCGKEGSGPPHHLLAAICSARSFPEAGTAQEVPSERAALAPHRRVAEWVVAPGTQCPWHGGQPSHHKSPFVLTPLALKRQVTRLHWAQGPDCGLSPCPAGLAGFREGAS